MKLYTEEQLLQAYDLGLGLTDDEVLAEFTPIELPTDEEIQEGLFHHSNEYAYGYKDAFKLMRYKIQGGKK